MSIGFVEPYNRLQEIQDIKGKTKDVNVVNQLNGLIKMARELRWQLVVAAGRFEKHWLNAKK